LSHRAAQRQAKISSEDQRRNRYLHSVLVQLPQNYLVSRDAHGMKIPHFPSLLTEAVKQAFPMFRVVHEIRYRSREEKFRSWLLTPENNVIDLFSGRSGAACEFEASRIYSREEEYYYPHLPASLVLRNSARLIRFDKLRLEIIEDLKTILIELQKRR